MTDILIRRCSLEIHRTGGWCWTGSPEEVAQQAIRALPELLDRALASLRFPEEAEELGLGSVALNLRLTSDEFHSLRQGLWPRHSIERFTTALQQQIDDSVLTVEPPQSPGEHVPTAMDPTQREIESSSYTALDQQSTWTISLLDRWRREGQLAEMLAGLSSASLERIESALFATVKVPQIEDTPVGSLRKRLQRAAAEVCAVVPAPPHPDSYRRWRIRMALEVCAIAGVPIAIESLSFAGAELTRRQKVTEPSPTPAAERIPGSRADMLIGSSRAISTSSGDRAVQWDGEVRICSALPFLLLGVLDRLGFLKAAGAMLETNESSAMAAEFGVALAYKALPPLGRGWFRPEETRIAAAAVAGLKRPLAEDRIHELARRSQQGTELLDAFTLSCLAPGHSSHAPLWLTQRSGQFELWEPEGLMPIASALQLTGLLPVVAQFARFNAPLFLDGSISRASDLDLLDNSGMVFVTPNAPGRGQERTVLHEGGQRFWTNNIGRLPDWFRAWLAAELQEEVGIGECARRQWEALGEHRNVAPLVEGSDLNRSLMMTASLGLGTLAWDLWGASSQARVEPLMALHSFGDMEALVRFHREKVRVHLPLGRRYLDLDAHRILRPVSGIPWMQNRVVEFAKW